MSGLPWALVMWASWVIVRFGCGLDRSYSFFFFLLGIVVCDQSPAEKREQRRKEMKSRCSGGAMQIKSLYSLE